METVLIYVKENLELLQLKWQYHYTCLWCFSVVLCGHCEICISFIRTTVHW